MSSIGAIGGASSAWSGVNATRDPSMKDRMFAKVDSDGSGAVDQSELQGMLDHISAKSGGSAGSAQEALASLDSDGDGSLGRDELEAGIQDLMPPPASTMEFAAGGRAMPSGGGGAAAPAAAGSSESNESTDPLDTNEDGEVSEQERLAGERKEALTALAKAADSDGDGALGSSERATFQQTLEKAAATLSADEAASATSSAPVAKAQGAAYLVQLAQRMVQEYAQTAAATQGGSGSTLDITA